MKTLLALVLPVERNADELLFSSVDNVREFRIKDSEMPHE